MHPFITITLFFTTFFGLMLGGRYWYIWSLICLIIWTGPAHLWIFINGNDVDNTDWIFWLCAIWAGGPGFYVGFFKTNDIMNALGIDIFENTNTQTRGHADDPTRDTYHTGRNRLCWCGSGEQYKYCHGALVTGIPVNDLCEHPGCEQRFAHYIFGRRFCNDHDPRNNE